MDVGPGSSKELLDLNVRWGVGVNKKRGSGDQTVGCLKMGLGDVHNY